MCHRTGVAFVVSVTLVLALSACSPGAEEPDSDSDEALAQATSVCVDALPLIEGDDVSGYAEGLQDSANDAAEASLQDQRWDSLASATNDLASVFDRLAALGDSGAEGLGEVARLMPELEAAKTDFAGECRKVRAAGGDVDDDAISDFVASSEGAQTEEAPLPEVEPEIEPSPTEPPTSVDQFTNVQRREFIQNLGAFGTNFAQYDEADLIAAAGVACDSLASGEQDAAARDAVAATGWSSDEASEIVVAAQFAGMCV